MSDVVEPEITWHYSLEKYISDTGEKAMGLAWLHMKAERLYSYSKSFIDLPVIIVSGLVGFLNVGAENIFGPGNSRVSSISLGSISLFVSVLNSIGSYYSWGKRAEAHRISNLQYSRLYRDIVIQLKLPRIERKPPGPFLKEIKDQFERLQEISPLIPDSIIKQFKNQFDKDIDISKPQETNGLHDIDIYPEPEVSASFPKVEVVEENKV
jgi:hypothetical protein